MTKKSIATSINLPVESVKTIIDVDDRGVEIPISDALNIFVSQNDKDGDDVKIRTMNSIAYVPSEYVDQRSIPLDVIEVEHDDVNIVNIKKRQIEKTNDLKFFKVKLTFINDLTREFIVPSFVKFYSSRTGSFVPVEFLRSRHILTDYTGNIVKADDSELVEDFKMTDYYTIKVVYDLEEKNLDEAKEKALPCTCNFYLNGVLANVAYNNFQIKESAADSEE